MSTRLWYLFSLLCLIVATTFVVIHGVFSIAPDIQPPLRDQEMAILMVAILPITTHLALIMCDEEAPRGIDPMIYAVLLVSSLAGLLWWAGMASYLLKSDLEHATGLLGLGSSLLVFMSAGLAMVMKKRIDAQVIST